MRPFVLLLLALGCGDAEPPPEACDQPLPPADDDGQPWPTYVVANEAFESCEATNAALQRRRGSCADGKRFLERGGGYSGDTYYFAGDTLVGLLRWTDVVISCTDYRFGDVVCEELDAEELSCPRS